MQLGIRPKRFLPRSYKGFRLVRDNGRLYGIPEFLNPEQYLDLGPLYVHPATLSAKSRDELEALIEDFDARPYQPELLGQHEGYNLIRHGGWVYAVRRSAGQVNLNYEDERRRAVAVRGASRAEVEEGLRALARADSVEFAGWLPIYEFTANCGRHPQFTHVG